MATRISTARVRATRSRNAPDAPGKAHAGSADRQQLHFEHQGRVRRNDAARAACAIAKVGRYGELARAADLHALHAFVPAGDHAPSTKRKVERIAAVL